MFVLLLVNINYLQGFEPASLATKLNFAVLPQVAEREPYWDMKQHAIESGHLDAPEPHYLPIKVPRNSATGFICAFFAVAVGPWA